MKRLCIYLLLLTIPVWLFASRDLPFYHKHIIILVDQTMTPHKSSQGFDAIEKAICCLLEGKGLGGIELDNGETYPPTNFSFDPSTDEISLFGFGMPKNIFSHIAAQVYNSEIPVQKFVETVINNLIVSYGSLSESGKGLKAFLNEDLHNLCAASTPLAQTLKAKEGVNFSRYVYPLVLRMVNTDTVAVEYYIIIVSNFQTGLTGKGSQNDDNNYNDLCNKEVYKAEFTNELKKLKDRFYTTDFLVLQSPQKKDHNGFNQAIIALGHQLGVKSLQGVSVHITSNLFMEQDKPNSQTFELAPVSIAFPHDETLEVESLVLSITDSDGNILYTEKENDATLLASYYDEDEKKYQIPAHKITLSDDVEKGDDLLFNYVFYTMAKDADGNDIMPFVYPVSREYTLLASNFKSPMETSTFILPCILAALCLLGIAIWRGRRKEAEINVSEFLDEYIDVTAQRGAVRQSCLFHTHGQTPSPIPVSGTIRSAHRFFSIPWRTEAYAIIDDSADRVDGICYAINGDTDNIGRPTPICLEGGKFKFNITIYIDKTVDLTHVHDLKINIEIAAKSGLFSFPKQDATHYKLKLSNLKGAKHYEFRYFLIENIGNTWVGIDPGTTGSCIAISGDAQGTAATPSIDMVEVKRGQEVTNIIPSKLVLDRPSIVGKTIDEMQPGIDYDFGINADQTWKMHVKNGHNCYQSIKKLLGYKKSEKDKDDRIVARFAGGRECPFTGVELAHLLVKGLKKSLDDYLAALPQQRRQVILPDGEEPHRAVVAIPNNYTLAKTLDMVDSIKMLGTFREVRFIYEAEGVLFNYLRKTYGEKKSGSENVLVYDMGGATINVSVFQVKYYVDEDRTIRFNVKTLARIGYAVGGDNIDVALLETLLTMPELGDMPLCKDEKLRHEYEAQHKTVFLDSEHVFGLKKELVDAEQNKPVYALNNHGNFTNLLNRFLPQSLSSSAFAEMEMQFTDKMKSRLISSSFMSQFIYSNIVDAVNEVLNFKDVTSIDKVIFSGRSTLFPMVRYTVMQTIGKRFKNTKVWEGLTDDEIKTCVANGACWYGRYGLVRLDNSLINGSYGFKYTELGVAKLHVLLEAENYFTGESLQDSEAINSAFSSDSNNVCFYQVMGNGDTDHIFSPELRHKLNFLGAIHLKNKTSEITIAVDRKNKVTATVSYVSGHQETLNVEAEDHDLVNENEWPYIFHTLTDDQQDSTTPIANNSASQKVSGGKRRR